MISIQYYLGLSRLHWNLSPVTKYFGEELLQLDETKALALGLIWCKLKPWECPFTWFISTLPSLEDLPAISYYWKPNYFDAFKGTTVGGFLQGQKDRLESEVVNLKNVFKKREDEFKDLLEGKYGDLFGWALFCVESRVWGIHGEDSQYLRFGIGLDMLNHRDNGSYIDHLSNETMFQLVANQEYQENEEVYSNYGHYKGTNDWFLYYGFFTNVEQVCLFLDASKPDNLNVEVEGVDWSAWHENIKVDDVNMLEQLLLKRKIRLVMAQQGKYDQVEQYTTNAVQELRNEVIQKLVELESSKESHLKWLQEHENDTDKNVEYIRKASHMFREGEKAVAEFILKYLAEQYDTTTPKN